jgi:hypothetical protein
VFEYTVGMPLGFAAAVEERPRPSEDLSEGELLDRVSDVAVAVQRAGAELLALAYAWAVAHPADRLDPPEAGLPGRERATTLGGEGTPHVTEFAAATFGARMGRGTHAGRRHLAAALDLRLRLPRTWARVQALEVRDTYAIHLAEATRNLSLAEAAWVDQETHEQADGRIPWSRFQTLVAGKVAAAAPHLVREREERAARARFARKLRPLPGDEQAGMATFMVRAPLPVVDALDAAVTTLASRLERSLPPTVAESEDAPTTDDLRVQAVALLAAGQEGESGADLRDLLPRATVVLHFYGGNAHTDPETGERVLVPASRDLDEDGRPLDRVARIDDHGAVSESWVREVLGAHARFDVLPVLDIEGLAPVDAYEIPARHRRAVQLRHPVETFPFGHARSTSGHTQLDHEVPWSRQPGGGRTDVANLGPLHSFHHRLKTHGGWRVDEPSPGVHVWTDPWGGTYVRDASGTRLLRPDQPTRRPPVVEIYPCPRLEWAA